MTPLISVPVAIVLAGLMGTPWSIVAAPQHDAMLPPLNFDQPIRLYPSPPLGTFTRRISSTNAEAQAYFNQGFQLMYAFAKPEAGRSFREAERRDPDCAICFWGEAWAWGSYVNGRMTPEESPHAYAAIQHAVALAGRHASPVEQQLIQAMSVRYVEHFDPARTREQDAAYAEAMGRVAAAHPEDLDVATLYGEALFLLLKRPGLTDIHDPIMARLLGVLEAALGRDIHHVGACHMYVHATELTIHPEKAEACVAFLGNAIPGASHLNHMPAHVWTKVGRWGDAVRASLQAWNSDRLAKNGLGVATYPDHDLMMLVFAACMDGQGAVAIQAGRDFTAITNGDSRVLALALVRFGRFDDIARMGPRPADDIAAGMWDFAHGYAELRAGHVAAARASLDRLHATAAASTATFKFHSAKTLLGILGGILDGEIHRQAGDLPAAIALLERAVVLQDSLIVDDPEPLPIAARQWLGAALLQAGRVVDAERVYREDLVRHPHNGWSLVGLQQALQAQKKSSAAVDADLRASWARSDTPIHASRF